MDANFKVNLVKGQKVDIDKGVMRVNVELGWSANVFDGSSYDLDVTAFLLDSSHKTTANPFGKVMGDFNQAKGVPNNMIFYNNLEHPTGAVKHTGDERTGQAGGIGEADETIFVDFSKMPADTDSIIFCVTIHNEGGSNVTFGQVSDAFIRIVNADSNAKMLNYDLGEDFSVQTAVVAGRLYKHNGNWKFEAIGNGFNDGLTGLCRLVGLDA